MTTKRPTTAADSIVSSRSQSAIRAKVREKKAWMSFEGKGRGKDYLSALADFRKQERTSSNSPTS